MRRVDFVDKPDRRPTSCAQAIDIWDLEPTANHPNHPGQLPQPQADQAQPPPPAATPCVTHHHLTALRSIAASHPRLTGVILRLPKEEQELEEDEGTGAELMRGVLRLLRVVMGARGVRVQVQCHYGVRGGAGSSVWEEGMQ